MSISSYLNKFDLPILISLILLPILSFFCVPIYLYNYGIVWQELVMLILGLFIAGTGITIGYHRLFSHKSFKTFYFVEWLFMIAGSMALQNTILKIPRIAVDTHVFRVSNRIGIVKTKTADLTQSRLETLIPKKWLMTAHHMLILHGRKICKSQKPLCNLCSINQHCHYKKNYNLRYNISNNVN